MKIVFLDFDGVLNSANGPKGKNGLLGLCPTKVALVERLCQRTGAEIVVSSTWRHGETVGSLADLLEAHGMTNPDLVVGVTPDLTRRDMRGGEIWMGVVRGDEIEHWLNRHPKVTHFVILDDDRDMGKLLPHLVKTDFADGLTEEHVERAARVLSEMEWQAA